MHDPQRETPQTPRAWLRLALRELRGAEQALEQHQSRASAIGIKRAAGMALRGALLATPNPAYGRSYVDHVRACAEDPTVPEAVRTSAARVVSASASDQKIVVLRAPAKDRQLVEAARDVLAHAYACIVHAEAHRASTERAQ